MLPIHVFCIWIQSLKSFYHEARSSKKRVKSRGGHRHLQIGRMLDIDLISEPPPQMYVSKVWESVWPEGAGSDS